MFKLAGLIAGSMVVGALAPLAYSNSQKPRVTVQGNCRSAVNGGNLTIYGRGFNPRGLVLIVSREPTGESSTSPAQYVDRGGNIVIGFNCSIGPDSKPEPAGTHSVEISEYVFSGKKVIAKFEVGPKVLP